MRNSLSFCLSMSLAVAGCASSPVPVASAGDRYSHEATGVEDYRLGVGDKLKIIVFNETMLSGEFAVGADGNVSMPLIGNVPAMGKRPGEIAADIKTSLANGFLRDPQVSAEVVVYRPFFILGEVKAPGQYPYASGLTALNAIATAQGFTPRAERKTVFIRRSGSGTEEAFSLTPDLRVWPGDTIRLGERYF